MALKKRCPCGLEGEEKARFPQGRDCTIYLAYVILHLGINVKDINLKFHLKPLYSALIFL
jgi:hypothetical protein